MLVSNGNSLPATWRRVWAFLSVPKDSPDLVRSQFAAFSKQVPVLYGILLANTVALAATHLQTAPAGLTLAMPVVLGALCLARVAVWRRRSRVTLTDAATVARLRTTMWLTVLLGSAFTAWALCLFPYGNAAQRCHVAFYMSITVISCIFCLMHLRGAALMLTTVVVLPFSGYLLLSGEVVLMAIALNFILVVCGMIFILLRNYDDFADLIVSKRELVTRQAETQRLSDENTRLANLDSLTGLPNRRSFLARLDTALAVAVQTQTRFAVALVDLDGFKAVNDTYGHSTGDRLLAEVGDRLMKLAGPTVSVARLGGDEFGIVLAGDPSDADIQSFGDRACAHLEGPYLRASVAAEVSGSLGFVAYPDGGSTAEQLFERADYALYHAKEIRRGHAVMFSAEHETNIRVTARLEQALRHADLEAELWVAYQPIVDAETSSVLGFEALARWASPTLGRVGPDQFIPAAERTRLVGKLTQVLLSKTLSAAALWPPALRVAFNLSAQDLITPQTMEAIQRIVLHSGVDPRRIDIEITETAVMRDFQHAAESLRLLRQLGIRISLDDFGTGFSSLSHVHRLKPDKIKIDRTFITDICSSQASRNIVRTVVDLCQNLELDCVVEGVETAEQMEMLSTLGCKVMQGFLFSKPMPDHAINQYLGVLQEAAALPACQLLS